MSTNILRAINLVVVSAICLAAKPTDATMMLRRLALPDVTLRAARIVHGTVSEVTTGRDEHGVAATWVTLRVTETLKGRAASTLTIKQFGVREPWSDGTIARVPGLPTFSVGEEVVLFLRGDSGRGFTSPVGLGQGVYRVRNGLVRRDIHAEPQLLESLLSTVAGLTGVRR